MLDSSECCPAASRHEPGSQPRPAAVAPPLPVGSRLLQDLGFLAFTLPHVEILTPTKKPRGQELTLDQQVANQALHCRRLRIEHVNSSVKRCRDRQRPDPSVEGGRSGML